MPQCPSCQTACAADARYCGHCGKALSERIGVVSSAHTKKSLDLVDVHSELGLVYFKKGQYREALHAWEKALSLNPDDAALAARIDEAKTRLAGDV